MEPNVENRQDIAVHEDTKDMRLCLSCLRVHHQHAIPVIISFPATEFRGCLSRGKFI